MHTNGRYHGFDLYTVPGPLRRSDGGMLEQLVENVTTLRRMFQEQFGGRRDVDAECGWPKSSELNANKLRDLFDRDAIARRVVELMPEQAYQVMPEVYEEEKGQVQTPFEKSWADLQASLSSRWHGGEPTTIMSYLKSFSIRSGIGSFGILLIGLDDGKRLDEPAEGVVARVEGGIAFNAQNRLVDSWMTEAEEEALRKLDLSDLEKQSVERWAAQRTMIANAVAKVREVHNFTVGDDGADNPYSMKSAFQAQANDDWFGVQFGEPEEQAQEPTKQKRRVLFLRVFDESAVQVVRWETSTRSSRFGQPVMYRVTFNDPREQSGDSLGMPSTTAMVHWSRVVHRAKNATSPGVPIGQSEMLVAVNEVLDLRKVRGAGSEGYWKCGIPGLTFETHPQMGADVEVDTDALKEVALDYQHSLQRFLFASGGSWKTVAPQMVDPTPYWTIGVESICIAKKCPVRIFKGSERGELASSQDDSQWNDQVAGFQNFDETPNGIVPVIDRFILMGVLEPPRRPLEARTTTMNRARRRWVYNADEGELEERTEVEETTVTETAGGYKIEWPALDSLGDAQKADLANKYTAALAAYVQSGAADFMPPFEYFTIVWKMDDEEAQSLADSMEKRQEEAMEEQQALAEEQGFQMEAPEGMVDPEQRELEHEEKLAQAEAGGKPNPFGGGGGKGKPPFAENAFCPTGEGGGIDPTCPSTGGSATKLDDSESEAMFDKFHQKHGGNADKAGHGHSEIAAALASAEVEKHIIKGSDGLPVGAIAYHVNDMPGRFEGDLLVDHLGSTGEVKGVGKSLMAIALKHAAENDIGVSFESTPNAQEFYTKLGFKRIDEQNPKLMRMSPKEVKDAVSKLGARPSSRPSVSSKDASAIFSAASRHGRDNLKKIVATLKRLNKINLPEDTVREFLAENKGKSPFAKEDEDATPPQTT